MCGYQRQQPSHGGHYSNWKCFDKRTPEPGLLGLTLWIHFPTDKKDDKATLGRFDSRLPADFPLEARRTSR